MTRLRSTGRAPSVDLDTLKVLLTRYFDEDKPSVAEIAVESDICMATVRKYLRLGLGRALPRGKASLLSRGEPQIQARLRAVPTSAILGHGRMELMARRREAGVGIDAIASEFGVSRQRVKDALAEIVFPQG